MVVEDTLRHPPRRRAPRALAIVLAAAVAACGPAPAPHVSPAPRAAPGTLAEALTDTVHAVLARALADSAFPGAIAAIGDSDSVYARVAVGHLDWAPSPVPDENTIWDLASLTKVIGTTTAVMQLWDAGKIDLDAKVQRYLPEWTGPHKDEVTVRHLLTHSAGLPAFELYYKAGKGPAETMAMIMATPLDTVPGARMVYSDIGAILLGRIVERISGETLDRYLASHVFAPLGMTSTTFKPPASLLPRIAPTERDPWRGRLVRGEVHDENAYELGGVSGHAGLFSSARDLTRFAQMYLRHGIYDGMPIISAAAVDTFTRIQDSTLSNRALGWEKPNGTNSAGHLMSPLAFGHTGFTGTSIWIDPARDLFVLLLTNRVDPTRENRRIIGVRVALADAVVGTYDAHRPPTPAADHSGSGSAP